MPVEQFALERVVRTAPELDVLRRGLAPPAVRVHVMELDEDLRHVSGGDGVSE